MKKFAKKIVCLLSFTALATAMAGLSFAEKTTITTARASTNADKDATTLLAPNTYQQYLDLTAPMDVAVSNDYMAIADGNAIYVYDVFDGEYRKYEHTLNQTDPTKNNVMELQFYGDDGLYFLDGTYLYLLDPETLEVSDVSITDAHPKFPCSSFLILDDVLYYTDVKTQASISYITLDGEKAATLDTVPSKPTIAFWGNELYYTNAGKHLYKVDPQTNAGSNDLFAFFREEVVSMQIQDNVFTCTTLSGDFYAYSLSELASVKNAESLTPLAHYQGDYSSLALFGDYVYAVNGRSICQYSIKDSAFTDFEICSSSDSLHRLDGAKESLLSHGKLYIADNGNNRISVYDVKNDTFETPIATEFSPIYLAGDETTLLAANETKAVLYDLTLENYGEVITVFQSFNGNLVGIANVYGNYYFVTDGNHYYRAEQDDLGAWTLTEQDKASTRYARLLTADAYGYLYVASGNSVYRFTEETFLSPTVDDDTPYATIPTGSTKILVDYNGDVYALANGVLQKATEPNPYEELNEPPVYAQTAVIQSFAFGIEDNETYLLYQDHYLAKTELLDLPTVKNIPVNGIDQPIFDENTANVELVRLRENAMVIDFDLTALSGAEVFPYLNYSRFERPLIALKIGQTTNGKHTVFVFYDEEMRAYRSCLALTSDCFALTDEEKSTYQKDYATPKTMYVSNEVPVYKFPHLEGLPTVTTLSRNTKIKVLGEINDLDYSYYLVTYTDGDVTYTGYVPQPYAIDFDPTTPTPNEQSYGAEQSNQDNIWRLVFLLLGSAAVLILIDTLIFRAWRKKNDE